MTTSRPQSQRKSVSVTIDQELLATARRYDLNLSRLLENSLLDAIKRRQQDDWLGENQSAIDAYNERVDKYSVFSDGQRRF
jgi:antitoxin CcdA